MRATESQIREAEQFRRGRSRRPMDRDRHAGDTARRSRGHDGFEGIDVAHLVAKDGDGSGAVAGDELLDGLPLAACIART